MIFLSGDHLANVTSWHELSLMDKSFSIFAIVGVNIATFSNFVYLGIFPGVAILTWFASINFSTYVASRINITSEWRKTCNWSEIYMRYQMISQLCKMISETFCQVLIPFTAYVVITFAITLDSIIISTDVSVELQHIIG